MEIDFSNPVWGHAITGCYKGKDGAANMDVISRIPINVGDIIVGSKGRAKVLSSKRDRDVRDGYFLKIEVMQ